MILILIFVILKSYTPKTKHDNINYLKFRTYLEGIEFDL